MWFDKLMQEEVQFAAEDMQALQAAKKRVLIEFELLKEGCDLPKADPSRQQKEEPISALIHGPPGIGKS